jgi:hypothetical protein
MGWHFTLQQANTIAWLTAPGEGTDQGIDLAAAHQFFMGMASQTSGSGFFVSHSKRHNMLICPPDMPWEATVYAECFDYANRNTWEHFNEADLRLQLSRFRRLFDGFNLYALGIPAANEDSPRERELRAFLLDGAFSSTKFGLFLILEERATFETIVSPFPAFRLVGSSVADLPGVLFWTPSGNAALCSLEQARDVYARIRPHIRDAQAVNRILDDFTRDESRCPVLLHLSDLHFGTVRARDSQN